MFLKGKRSDNHVLLEKIRLFVKRFYLNRLTKAALIGALLLIVSFFVFNAIEYFSWFSGEIRFYLFLVMIAVVSVLLFFYFVVPFVNLLRFRKKMSEKEAAKIIGDFFPEIRDKLLNTLQLVDESDSVDDELLLAAIEQKTEAFNRIRFSDAVDFTINYKYLNIFAVSFLMLILLVVFVPDFSREPIVRIVNYDKVYEKPLPFHVAISSVHIDAVQGDDVEFKIRVTGEGVPENFYVETAAGNRMMSRISDDEFKYVFDNVYRSEKFTVTAGDYRSREILIDVHPIPALLRYETRLSFPEYLRRETECLVGKTHVVVPQGTDVEYVFYTSGVDVVNVSDDASTREILMDDDMCAFNINALYSQKFFVRLINKWDGDNAPMSFVVDVVPDAYPDIQVQAFNEEFSKKNYYSGLLADDYGFSRLLFHFEVNGKPDVSFVKSIDIDKNDVRTSFYYSLDMDTLDVYPGDEVELYFEIWDNDAINGPKSRRSEVFHVNVPSLDVLDSIADSVEENIISELEDKTAELDDLRKDIEEVLKDLMSKKELDWTDKEKIQRLIERQKEVQREWENLQRKQNELQELIESNDLLSEDLLQKQERIKDLFDEVLPEDMKKLMEEMEKLLSDMPRDKMQQMMQELKKNNKELHDMMDRNLSLLERLKVEKELNELIDNLNVLADDLTGHSGRADDSLSALDAKELFGDLMKRFDTIKQKDEMLLEPFGVSIDEDKRESVNGDLDKSEELENEGDDEGASDKKREAGKKMKEMAEQLSMDLMMSGMEQLGEDAHLVRILLENVVRSSHEEESLIVGISKMKNDDPSLSLKISRQKEIVDNFVMVGDSLRMLAMRQPDIKDFVFNELDIIEQQLEAAMRDMNELKLGAAVAKQQRSMMSMNNLALMLAESLNDMNSNMMSASGSCSKQKNSKKPNKSGQSIKDMKDLQEQLGKQLERLREEIQSRNRGGEQQMSMSEEFARMAAQQELLREEMQRMLSEMKENGIVGDDGINDIIREMEKLEEDIVNKRITNQTINRNKDILSRMLKAENAQMEREKDEQRRSDEFRGTFWERMVDELEYEKNLKRQQDFLRNDNVEYQPFYKQKINEYFFKKNNN